MQVYLFAADAGLMARWQGALPVPVRRCEGPGMLDDLGAGAVLIVHWDCLNHEQRQKLLTGRSGCRVIVLVDQPTAAEGERLLSHGIGGYANTYIQPDLLPEVLTRVARGDIWAGPELMQRMLKRLLARRVPVFDQAAGWQLSTREQQVLDLLVSGQSNKQIARQLDITERTVKAHVSAILEKSGVRDRIELILILSGQEPSDSSRQEQGYEI